MRKFFVAFFVVAAIYGVAWCYGMHHLQEFTQARLSALRAAGCMVTYEGIEKAGFPFHARLRLVRPVIQGDASCELRPAGDVILQAALWRPQHIHVSVNAPTFFIMGGAAPLMQGSVERIEGVYESASHHMDLKNVHVQKGLWAGMQADKLCYGLTHEAVPEAMLKIYDLEGAGLAHHPLGEKIEEISLRAKKYGPIVGDSWSERLRLWSENEGRLDVTALRLKWGQLDITGTGELSLDGTLQPAGYAHIHVEGADKTIDTLVEDGRVDATLGGMLKMGAALLTASTQGAEEEGKPLVFHLKQGQIYMGTVPLLRLEHLIVPGLLQFSLAPPLQESVTKGAYDAASRQ